MDDRQQTTDDGFVVCGLSSVVKNETMNRVPDLEQQIKSACGGSLKDPSLYPSADFHGETVYFCNTACLNAFLKSPEAFMAGEVEHPEEEAA